MDQTRRAMKLAQGQTWKIGEQYVRIARLERLAVEYKTMDDLVSRQGVHHKSTKKDFCRLIKSATLLSAEEVSAARDVNSEMLSESEIEKSGPASVSETETLLPPEDDPTRPI